MIGFQTCKISFLKIWFSLFVILIFLLILSASIHAQDIFVVVDGQEISRDFYERALKAAVVEMEEQGVAAPTGEVLSLLRQNLIDQIIDVVLIVEGASEEGISASGQEIEDKIKEVKDRFPESGEFQASLTKQGLTLDDLVWDIKAQILKEKLIEYFSKKFAVSDEETLAFYWRNKEMFVQSPKLRLNQIVLTTSFEARDVRKRIVEGENFEELARKYSKDFGSRDFGGDLGYVAREDLDPEVAEAAFSLKISEVSPVVKSPLGYHLLLVSEKIAGRSSAFDDVKVDILMFLQKEKGRGEFDRWLINLRETSQIKLFTF
ncbi:MAG: peptidylprolyl isomerase [Candidatus Margulisbacteria bacterium]|nr:peptidylprolyl isomerase [Candidatus Margulisiibacteriota bacterium]MBU1022484.1 peptidylprolyl isomerase [Candidatus Margulisiibacteriota bacterium]MBU1728468.1 peptidylprolyl isomerase [Candidatus Margulisiibacteriota bacterium]MBU1954615.1 peptidylprolyl isomerase [Candidatus Margulisiibacteriota bacterium]